MVFTFIVSFGVLRPAVSSANVRRPPPFSTEYHASVGLFACMFLFPDNCEEALRASRIQFLSIRTRIRIACMTASTCMQIMLNSNSALRLVKNVNVS